MYKYGMPGYISDDSDKETNGKTLRSSDFQARTRPAPKLSQTSNRSGSTLSTATNVKENKPKFINIKPQEGIVEDVNFSDEDEKPKKPIVKKSDKLKEDTKRSEIAKNNEDKCIDTNDNDQVSIEESRKESTNERTEKRVLNKNENSTEKVLISKNIDKVQKETKEEAIIEEVVKKNSNQQDIYLNLVIENLRDFVYALPPKEQDFKCRITRDVKGIEKNLHPTYYMHLERDDGRKVFLLAARKTNFGVKSKYFISIDPIELTKKGQNYVGVLTEQKGGNKYCLYNDGESFEKVGMDAKLRRELVSIVYQNSLLGIQGPRKMTILLPGFEADYKQYRITEDDSLLERFKKGRLKYVMQLNNKDPTWNEKTSHYALNFHGRVSVSSVKNFQIIDSKIPDKILLQFGKVHDDTFICDYSYPFSAIEAFAIALSSFDN